MHKITQLDQSQTQEQEEQSWLVMTVHRLNITSIQTHPRHSSNSSPTEHRSTTGITDAGDRPSTVQSPPSSTAPVQTLLYQPCSIITITFHSCLFTKIVREQKCCHNIDMCLMTSIRKIWNSWTTQQHVFWSTSELSMGSTVRRNSLFKDSVVSAIEWMEEMRWRLAFWYNERTTLTTGYRQC